MRVWLPVASTVVGRDRSCFSPECLVLMLDHFEERSLPVTFAFRQQVVGRTVAGKVQLVEAGIEVQADLAPAFVTSDGLRALVDKGLSAGIAGRLLATEMLDTIKVVTRMLPHEVSVLPLNMASEPARRVRFVEDA